MDAESLVERFYQAAVVKWVQADLTFDETQSAICTLKVRPEHLQGYDMVHGGLITFVADTSAWFTAALAAQDHVMTSHFNMNLLRPATEGMTLRAIGTLVKSGRVLVVVRAEVFAGDTLIADGTFTHARFPLK